MTRVRVRLVVARFDLWVGVYIDRPRQRVYVLPIPCIGLVIEWGSR